jgi:hypothetical protein
VIVMGNKNHRFPQRQPSATATDLQRLTEVRKAIELEQIFERKDQARILSEILKRHGYDMPAEESYRLLAMRRESVTHPVCGAGLART